MTTQPPVPDDRPPQLAEDSPTELVEADDGELIERLGIAALFSGFGLYVGLYGAAGPTVLWLTGRAQGHSLGWYLLTAAKMALFMIGIVIGVAAAAVLVLGGGLGPGALVAAVLLIGTSLVVSVPWALATWSADVYIAHARVSSEE